MNYPAGSEGEKLSRAASAALFIKIRHLLGLSRREEMQEYAEEPS